MQTSILQKNPTEAMDFTWDFLPDMAVSETITSITSVLVYNQGFLTSDVTVSGTAITTASRVTALLAGGVNGVTYVAKCQVVTNLGQTLIASVWVAIQDDATN